MASVDRDWELFSDWCAAVGLDPVAANGADVNRFGDAISGSPATACRRIRRIRARLGLRTVDAGRAVRSDEVRAVGDVLAASIITGWPGGVRGRRDAAIVALRGRMRLTRAEVRALGAADFRQGLGSIAVLGRTIPGASEPGRCPACAVTRWLRITARLEEPAAWRRLRNDWSGRWPSAADTESEHDCARRLPGGWQHFRTLLPAIDRHGWIADDRSLSARAISTVTNRSVGPDEPAPGASQPWARGPRVEWDRVAQVRELEYLGPLFDRLEQEIDRALDRTRGLLRGN